MAPPPCLPLQLSDVMPSSSLTFFHRAGTHDRAWVWKPLNKARWLCMRVAAPGGC